MILLTDVKNVTLKHNKLAELGLPVAELFSPTGYRKKKQLEGCVSIIIFFMKNRNSSLSDSLQNKNMHALLRNHGRNDNNMHLDHVGGRNE